MSTPIPDRWAQRRRAVEFLQLVVEDLMAERGDGGEAWDTWTRSLSLVLDALTLLADAVPSSPLAPEGRVAASTLRDLPETLYNQAQNGRELIYLTMSWLGQQISRETLRASVLAHAYRVADDIGAARAAKLRELLDEAWRDAA